MDSTSRKLKGANSISLKRFERNFIIRSAFRRFLKFIQITEDERSLLQEPILQNGWIFWSPSTHLNFSALMFPILFHLYNFNLLF